MVIEGVWLSTQYACAIKSDNSLRAMFIRELRSIKKCLHSVVGYWHNETINITSHWGGAVIVATLAAATYPLILHKHPTADWRDALGFYIFFAAAITCLISSGAFHCFVCHSQPVAKRWHAMDYAGIVGMHQNFFTCYRHRELIDFLLSFPSVDCRVINLLLCSQSRQLSSTYHSSQLFLP